MSQDKEDIEYYFKKYNTSDTSIWGPHYWFVIHNFSATYPDTPSEFDIEIAKNFIRILPFLLPCGVCSTHCFEYFKTLDQKSIEKIVSSKYELFRFFYNFHNTVTKNTKQ